MRQTKLFTQTRREAPKDETAKNAQLLIRAGFIHKELAGVYDLLPLGRKVIERLTHIVRREMEALGGQEISMSALQNAELWKKTDRFDDAKVDNWFKTEFKAGGETGLGITHEEPITAMLREHISSYRSLPMSVFQFQTKFRNELRAKSGILRGREFLMKDLYTFCRTQEEHAEVYENIAAAYGRIFSAVGIGEVTYRTYASGGIFAQFSDEFQTRTDAGEDIIYYSKEKGIAVNKEVCTDDVLAQLGLVKNDLEEIKAVETGNIFSLGTRFSEPLELLFADEAGERHPVIMGSYGIGIGRLMGIIVEVLSDDKGLVWPELVAPFSLHLLNIGASAEAGAKSEALYQTLTSKGIDVLFDDRDARAGAKFADADLLGMPLQVIVSDKNAADAGLEVKYRATGEVHTHSESELIELLSQVAHKRNA